MTGPVQSQEAPPAGIVTFCQRPDLSFERISPLAAAWTGVPLQRWLQDKDLFLQLVDAADREAVCHRLPLAARPEGLVQAFHLRHVRTQALTPITEFRLAVGHDGGQLQAYEGVWVAHLEPRLRTASWKQALAVLTRGLVHDFNNALTGIVTLSEHFVSQTDPQHPFHEGLDLIHQSARGAAKLAHRLQRLHDQQPGQPTVLDLNATVTELAELLGRCIPKRVELSYRPWATPVPVQADAVGLQQSICYLTLNAAEAIVGRGKIQLETSAGLPAAQARYLAGRPVVQPAACFGVSDTGPGVPAEHLDRIVQPFFSTKSPAQALGLGLHQVRQFVQDHGGALTLEPAADRGSTFRLWLPLVPLE